MAVGGEGTRTRRQLRAQATAEQLLGAAREVFEGSGYRATTVGAITQRANTAHGTFYLYFRNKEDVFGRVMAAVVTEIDAEISETWHGDPREGLRRSIGGFFSAVGRHKGLWRCLMEGMMQSVAIERMWLDLRRPFVDRIELLLTTLVAEERMPPIDTVAAAAALGSMVEWSAFTTTELGEPPGLTVERSVEAVTDLFFAATLGRSDG